MEDINKLRHLIEHWLEHNEEHALTYRQWAEKARAAGEADVSAILSGIAEETEKLNVLFRKAADSLKAA